VLEKLVTDPLQQEEVVAVFRMWCKQFRQPVHSPSGLADHNKVNADMRRPKGRRFVLVDDRGIALNFGRAYAIRAFREPSETHRVGPYEVLIYSQGVSPP
jgi:hypothetical protein